MSRIVAVVCASVLLAHPASRQSSAGPPADVQAHISGPDVGVMTTAADMAKWVIAVSSSRLWTAASRDAMWTPATLGDGRDAVSFPAALGYGLGWGVSMVLKPPC